VRIACLVPAFPALSETFILNRIVGLVARGAEVEILAERRGDMRTVHADVDRFDLLAKTKYWDLPRESLPRITRAMGAALKGMWSDPERVVSTLDIGRFGLAAATLVPLVAASQLRPPRAYDVLYCHYGPTGLIATALRELGLLHGKIVTAFYGYDLTMVPTRFGTRVYDRLFRHGDLCLPLCDVFRRRLIRLGCDPGAAWVHHIGVDCGRFTGMARRPSRDGPKRIVSIARMVEKKGLSCGIRAVARVLQTHPNVEYVIIGDGPLRAQVEGVIDELSVGHAVKLVGWQQQNRVVETLQSADVLLVPSVTATDGDQEGTPTVLMEASAMGLPVVSTFHSGIPEIVEDGVSGYLVAEHDVDALAHRLMTLLNHPEQRKCMGQAGRKIVGQRFNIDKLNDELMVVFEHLCRA
jgi:colanic acid/amylovoran biosynthesis glycosyltransferase